MRELFSISSDSIDVNALNEAMTDLNCGAYVSFEGRVRSQNKGKKVAFLEYEAFAELALTEFTHIADEATKKFELEHITCVHRVGKLELGEVAVWIGVLAKHRQAAFLACAFIISELKKRVPIWKKEVYLDDNSAWIDDCHGCIQSNEDEQKFYQRQTNLSEVGKEGQAALKKAKVLVVGAGGLGCPALQYLAAAGVGNIGVIDDDTVDISNLHRQVLYDYADCGQQKVQVAAHSLRQQNPFITINAYTERLSAKNAEVICKQYDIILDCTDNFVSKFLLNDAAYLLKKVLVRASVFKFEGMLETYVPHTEQACLRCLWPQMPEQACVQSCAQTGVLGPVVGILGAWQAMQALKVILGMQTEAGMSLVNVFNNNLQFVQWPKNLNCQLCGVNATIKSLRPRRLIKVERMFLCHPGESRDPEKKLNFSPVSQHGVIS